MPHMVVNDRDWLARGPVIVANGRWVPPVGLRDARLLRVVGGAVCEGQPACAWVGPDDAVSLEPQGVDAWFERMTGTPRGLGGRRRMDSTARGTWSPRTATICTATSRRRASSASATGTWRSSRWWARSIGCAIHETARIDPYTVFDTTNGPIIAGTECLGAAVHADRGPVFDRRRLAAFPRQPARMR